MPERLSQSDSFPLCSSCIEGRRRAAFRPGQQLEVTDGQSQVCAVPVWSCSILDKSSAIATRQASGKPSQKGSQAQDRQAWSCDFQNEKSEEMHVCRREDFCFTARLLSLSSSLLRLKQFPILACFSIFAPFFFSTAPFCAPPPPPAPLLLFLPLAASAELYVCAPREVSRLCPFPVDFPFPPI